MPVSKYRSVEDMPPPPRPNPEELLDRIRAVWNRAALLTGFGYPPGLYKFRTLEEAQAARDEVTRQRVQKLRGDPA